jgi:hypothetical protein
MPLQGESDTICFTKNPISALIVRHSMQKVRVYFRVVHLDASQPAARAPEPLHVQESRVGFNESSVLRFLHDRDHHCEVLSVAEKTREAIESALKKRFAHGIAVIESITWLT